MTERAPLTEEQKAKMAAGRKAVADKKAAAIKAAADSGDTTEDEGEDAGAATNATAYSKEDRAKIKKLRGYEIELDGTESSEVLDTMLEEAIADDQDEIGERKPVEGIADKLAARTQDEMVGGKMVPVPIHFVARGKGGLGMYNEHGIMIGYALNGDDKGMSKLNKDVTRVNALRRVNRMPGEH